MANPHPRPDAAPGPFDGRPWIFGPAHAGGLAPAAVPADATAIRQADRPRTHGGSRNAGRCMKANTSGLAGISFKTRSWSGKGPRQNFYVVAIWTDRANVRRSNAYNIKADGGPVHAMKMALSVRRQAGLPPVGWTMAMKALRRYLERIGHPIPDELQGARFEDGPDAAH